MRVHFSIWLASASAVESRSIGSGTIALSKKYMIRASATKNIMPRVAARRVMPMTILQFDGWLSDGLSPQRFQDIMVQPARHCPFGRLDVCCGLNSEVSLLTQHVRCSLKNRRRHCSDMSVPPIGELGL